ncbi:MAG TPA: AraC family transcriptional regulator [Blastocatellia bacterium]|nr:AraC family transcriptional regulator [Blastocatellia bacterium]
MERQEQEITDRLSNANADTFQRLVRARAFIDDCYHLPLDLEQISSEACLSRYHFLRLFRRAFNKTPHQYLTQRRIEKAKELLSSSGLTVTDVCFEVGFESLGSFSSLFHKHVGHPPITYRAIIFERRLEKQRRVPACFLMMHRVEGLSTAKPN